jgi:hypothetical protein
VSPPRLLALVLAILAVVLAVVVVRVGDRSPTSSGAGPAPVAARPEASSSRSTERRALQVLQAWDDRRADAYRSGSGRTLRSLYADGSSAGDADVRLLGSYRSRGFTVAGMRTQVLALDVLASGRSRLEVRIDDRVVGAVAIRGAERLALPRDAASTRVLTFARSGDGRWRVASVSEARRKERPG